MTTLACNNCLTSGFMPSRDKQDMRRICSSCVKTMINLNQTERLTMGPITWTAIGIAGGVFGNFREFSRIFEEIIVSYFFQLSTSALPSVRMPTLLEKIEASATTRLTLPAKTLPRQELARYKNFLKVETHRLKMLHRAGADGREICRARSAMIGFP